MAKKAKRIIKHPPRQSALEQKVTLSDKTIATLRKQLGTSLIPRQGVRQSATPTLKIPSGGIPVKRQAPKNPTWESAFAAIIPKVEKPVRMRISLFTKPSDDTFVFDFSGMTTEPEPWKPIKFRDYR